MRLRVGNVSAQVTDWQSKDLGVPFGTVASVTVPPPL
jgi:hypothetical protein